MGFSRQRILVLLVFFIFLLSLNIFAQDGVVGGVTDSGYIPFEETTPGVDIHRDSPAYREPAIEGEYAQGQAIVKFREASTSANVSGFSEDIQILNSNFGVTSTKRIFNSNVEARVPSLRNYFLFKFPESVDVQEFMSAYSDNIEVESTEPNRISRNLAVPNDPYYPQQYAFPLIHAEEAWDIEKGNPNMVVAVIDSGWKFNHTDFANTIWNNPAELPVNGIDDDGDGLIDDFQGWDYVENDNFPNPGGVIHGTHVAGTIATGTDNSMVTAGMCWNCKIMPLKVCGTYGCYSSDVAAAIIYAADKGASVINLSLGGPYPSNLESIAIDYAYSQGLVIVAAAGNDNAGYKFYPAAFDKVISVSATDSADERMDIAIDYGSEYGSWIDVAAPGEDIVSAGSAQTWLSISGTSMASPHVAGLAALLLSKDPSLSPEEIRTIIRSTAEPISPDKYIGVGRINAFKALSSIDLGLIANLDSSLDELKYVESLTIKGTASGSNFIDYVLEYGVGENPSTWTQISTSNTPVVDGALGTAASLPVGINMIRLTVNSSNASAVDKVLVETITHRANYKINYWDMQVTQGNNRLVEVTNNCSCVTKVGETCEPWIDALINITETVPVTIGNTTTMVKTYFAKNLLMYCDTGTWKETWNFGEPQFTNPPFTYEYLATADITNSLASIGGLCTNPNDCFKAVSMQSQAFTGSSQVKAVLSRPNDNAEFFAGEPVMFSALCSTPDGAQKVFSVGDNTPNTPTFSDFIYHNYYSTGIYTSKLTVDPQGVKATDSKNVRIVNHSDYIVDDSSISESFVDNSLSGMVVLAEEYIDCGLLGLSCLINGAIGFIFSGLDAIGLDFDGSTSVNSLIRVSALDTYVGKPTMISVFCKTTPKASNEVVDYFIIGPNGLVEQGTLGCNQAKVINVFNSVGDYSANFSLYSHTNSTNFKVLTEADYCS